MRDLKSENEALRKELERKNARSDIQAQELQSLRLSTSNLQVQYFLPFTIICSGRCNYFGGDFVARIKGCQ
jgi:hypothetical protein